MAAVSRSLIGDPCSPLEIATNEPTADHENVTNEPTAVHENATNEPTAVHENVTNEPTVVHENVTNEPKLVGQDGDNPTAKGGAGLFTALRARFTAPCDSGHLEINANQEKSSRPAGDRMQNRKPMLPKGLRKPSEGVQRVVEGVMEAHGLIAVSSGIRLASHVSDRIVAPRVPGRGEAGETPRATRTGAAALRKPEFATSDEENPANP